MKNTNEVERFERFKNLVWDRITPSWCLKHGVECVQEVPQIAPMDIFFLGVRMGEIHAEDLDFVNYVGDRIPMSLDGDDIAYLFPKDLYEKILVFNFVPD